MNVHFPCFKVKHQHVKVDKSEIQRPVVFQGLGIPGIDFTLWVKMEQGRLLFEKGCCVFQAEVVVGKAAKNGLCQFQIFLQLMPRGFPEGGSWLPA
jgi:hypothetical protein